MRSIRVYGYLGIRSRVSVNIEGRLANLAQTVVSLTRELRAGVGMVICRVYRLSRRRACNPGGFVKMLGQLKKCSGALVVKVCDMEDGASEGCRVAVSPSMVYMSGVRESGVRIVPGGRRGGGDGLRRRARCERRSIERPRERIWTRSPLYGDQSRYFRLFAVARKGSIAMRGRGRRHALPYPRRIR